jgi:hypothetical protein
MSAPVNQHAVTRGRIRNFPERTVGRSHRTRPLSG